MFSFSSLNPFQIESWAPLVYMAMTTVGKHGGNAQDLQLLLSHDYFWLKKSDE